MKKKKFQRNLVSIVVVLLLISIAAVFYFNVQSSVLPARSEYTSYDSWSGNSDLITYSSSIDNEPKPGLYNLHAIFAQDSSEWNNLVTLQNELSENDYECRITGSITQICNGRVRADNCQAYSASYDVIGTIIDVEAPGSLAGVSGSTWACQVPMASLYSLVPESLIEPDGDTKSVDRLGFSSGTVKFIYIGDTRCRTEGEECTNNVCCDGLTCTALNDGSGESYCMDSSTVGDDDDDTNDTTTGDDDTNDTTTGGDDDDNNTTTSTVTCWKDPNFVEQSLFGEEGTCDKKVLAGTTCDKTKGYYTTEKACQDSLTGDNNWVIIVLVGGLLLIVSGGIAFVMTNPKLKKKFLRRFK